jgi:hypothetical protein
MPRVFHETVIDPQGPPVHPRDTIAKAICGERFSNLAWKILKSFGFTFELAVIVAIVLGIAGLILNIPAMAYGGLVALPVPLLLICTYSSSQTKRLLVQFDFWVFVVLNTISIGGFIAMFAESPGFAVLFGCIGLGIFGNIMFDARPLGGHQGGIYLYAVHYAMSSIYFGVILALFYIGLFPPFRRPIFYIGLGNAYLDVASLTISCYQALFFLNLRMTYVLYRHRKLVDKHPMLILKAEIAYVVEESEPLAGGLV